MQPRQILPVAAADGFKSEWQGPKEPWNKRRHVGHAKHTITAQVSAFSLLSPATGFA